MKRRVLIASWVGLSLGATGTAGTPPSSSPSASQRATAATAVAHSYRACLAARPFYWEIGDQNARLAAGTEGGVQPSADSTLPISTASQWIFAAYVLQVRGGTPTLADIKTLTMRSGYTNLRANRCTQTVSHCFHAAHLVGGSNSDWGAQQADKFYYNGGHLQQLAASDPRLSGLTAAGLTAVIGAELGTAHAFSYESPLLDAGIRTTPAAYGAWLRKILSGHLSMHDQLGADPVCTNPSRCRQALNTPLPQTENPHYSLGHWVEDDPRLGDGAFSDPGLLGFYPWIDASRTYYGVLARSSSAPGAYVVSMQCGRLIRKAWLIGRSP